MKERKISLSKRLMAIVLCVCMMAVSFGTVVFAEKGTASTTDDVLFNMEDFTSMVGEGKATYGTSFAPSSLTTYSDGMISSSASASGTITIADTPSFVYERPAAGADANVSALFGQEWKIDDIPGKITGTFKLNKDLFASVDDSLEDGDYKYIGIGLRGLKSDGTSSSAKVFQFDGDGEVHINSTSGWADQGDYGDFDSAAKGGDGDGLYEFSIEVEKAFGAPKSGMEEQYYWKINVYSAEDGEGATNTGTKLHWMNLEAGDTKVSITNLASINGFFFGFAGDQKCRDKYSSKVELTDATFTIERFKVESASNSIFFDGGSAKVYFNNELDADTLSGITMTDINGNNIPVTVTADGATATVKPTVSLKNGAAYKINVADTVKNLSGYVAETASLDITAEDIFYQPDISGWDTTSGTMLNASQVETLSNGDVTTSFGATSTLAGWLVEDGAFTASNINKQSNYVYTNFNFDRDFSVSNMKGNIEFDFDLKSQKLYSVSTANGVTTFTENKEGTQAGANSWIGIRGIDGDGNSKNLPLFAVCADGSLNGQPKATWCGTYGQPAKANAAVLDGSWYKLKIVISPTSYTSNSGTEYAWKVVLKDRNNSNNTLITYYYTAMEFASINGIHSSVYEDNSTYRSSNLYWKTTVKNPVGSVNPFALEEEPENKINFKEDYNIVFNYDIDETTLNAITLEDANGTDVITGRSASGNVVTISFDELEYGASYTLNIDDTLRSADGYLIDASSYVMTAIYVAKTDVLYQEDYSTWDATDGIALTKSTISNYTSNSITLSNYAVGYVDGDTFVYARAYQNNASPDSSKFSFAKSIKYAEAISDVEFTFDLKKEGYKEASKDSNGVVSWSDCSNTAGTGARKLSLYYNNSSGTATATHIFGLVNSDGKLGSSGGNITTTAYTTQPSTDADDFYNLKLIISPTTTENQWTIKIYDRITGNLIGSVNVSDAAEILGYCLYTYQDSSNRTYTVTTTNEETGESTTTTVHKYLRTVLRNPKAIITPFEMQSPASTDITALPDSFDITFNADIMDGTANENTVTLTDSTGKNVITNYAVSGNTLTLSYGQLTIGEKYTLNIMYGIKSAKGADVITSNTEFTAIENPPLFYQDFSEIPAGSYTQADIAAVNSQIQPNANCGTLTADGKYLTMETTGNPAEFLMDFGEVSTGTYVAELHFKAEAPTNCSKYIYVKGANNTGEAYMKFGGAAKFTRNSAATYTAVNGHSYTDPTINTKTIDGEEYLKLKVVMSRNSTDDYWGIVVYDMYNDLKPLTLTKFSTKDNINRIGFKVNDWATGDVGSFSIKEVKVYETCDDELLFGNINTSSDYSLKVYTTDYYTTSNNVTSLTYNANTVVWHGAIHSRRSDGSYIKAIVAIYDENDNLITAEILPDSSLSYGVTKIEIDPEVATVDHAKLIILDNYDNITPLNSVINSTKVAQ